MMLIQCPYCGPRAQVEFTYVRSIDSIVPLDASAEAAMATLYTRDNPRGLSDELWRHTHGCHQFLTVRRDTVTHDIETVVRFGEALS